MGAKRKLCVTCATLTLLVVGCSNDTSSLDVDEKYLEGFDPAVVKEVAENEYYSNHIKNWDPPEFAYQGVVIEVQYCREVYSFYEEWKQTGVQPEIPAAPEPDVYFEVQGFTWPDRKADLQASIESDGIDGVVEFMSGQLGCGQRVPLEPGDHDGPTIQEVVLSETE